jgi:hypothetical protein
LIFQFKYDDNNVVTSLYWMMTHWLRIVTVLVGVALGVAVYLLLGLGTAEKVSKYTKDYFLFGGLAAIPLVFLVASTKPFRFWSFFLGIVIAVANFGTCLIVIVAASLPGDEFVPADIARIALSFLLLNAVILAVRFPKTLRLLVGATIATLIATMVILPLYMRVLIDAQLKKTVAAGGCVFTNKPLRRVTSASEIGIGLFIGHRSDRVIFVEKSGNYTWAYSELGLSSRRGVPVPAHANALPSLKVSNCVS